MVLFFYICKQLLLKEDIEKTSKCHSGFEVDASVTSKENKISTIRLDFAY